MGWDFPEVHSLGRAVSAREQGLLHALGQRFGQLSECRSSEALLWTAQRCGHSFLDESSISNIRLIFGGFWCFFFPFSNGTWPKPPCWGFVPWTWRLWLGRWAPWSSSAQTSWRGAATGGHFSRKMVDERSFQTQVIQACPNLEDDCI